MILRKDKWKKAKISEVSKTTSGGTPLRSRYDYYNGDILWVKSGELHDKYVFDTEEKITELGLEHSSAKLFPVNTVMIALYGVTSGTCAILKTKAASNQAVCGIIPFPEKLHYEFLYNVLTFKKSVIFQKRVGTYQLNISQEVIRNIEIPLPTIDEQKDISSVFQLLETITKKVEEQEKYLKEIAIKIIRDLTTTDPALGNLFNNSQITKRTLDELGNDYSKRVDDPRRSKYEKYVGSDSINRFDFKVENWESSQNVISAMKVFEPKDYLLVRRSLYASDFRERAPRADFYGICSGDILTIKENNTHIYDGYLLIILNAPRLWTYIVANASGSITRRVKWKELALFEISVPIISIQKTIVNLFDNIQVALTQVKTQKTRLNILKEKLLNEILG